MSKKTDAFYFEKFSEFAEYACKAASQLEDILTNYTPEYSAEKVNVMHEIEHSADIRKYEMTEALLRAFITPIEREDIMSIGKNIDNVTDAVEDTALRIYMYNVKKIRPEAIDFSRLVIRCCETLKGAIDEFQDFKKSKTLKEKLLEIERMEKEGDMLFIESMRALHTTESDPREIMIWSDIFNYFERCMDSCEHTAGTIETVIIKNT